MWNIHNNDKNTVIRDDGTGLTPRDNAAAAEFWGGCFSQGDRPENRSTCGACILSFEASV